jgi:hypothetical protein
MLDDATMAGRLAPFGGPGADPPPALGSRRILTAPSKMNFSPIPWPAELTFASPGQINRLSRHSECAD